MREGAAKGTVHVGDHLLFSAPSPLLTVSMVHMTNKPLVRACQYQIHVAAGTVSEALDALYRYGWEVSWKLDGSLAT